MDEEGTKAKEGARTASSRLGAALRRPVTARLAEPLAWASGLALAVPRMTATDEETVLRAATLFLLARLAVDTAPNLRAAARLEAEPYDQRPLRRALFRVKMTIALGCALATWAVARATPALADAAGGPTNVWVTLLAILSTYAVATPVLREHRGLPIARPNLGPAAGAVLFLGTVLVAPPAGAASLLVRAAACAVLGNLSLGLGQRFSAAARRVDRPFDWSFADPRTRDVVRPRAERDLARHAWAALPLLLLPVWPSVCAIWSGQVGDSRWLLVTAIVAGLPAILFDAARANARTAVAAVAAAALLAVSTRAAPAVDDPTLLAGAATALLYPGAGLLIASGHARALVVAAVAVLAARTFSTIAPQSLRIPQDWPVAEIAGTIAVTLAALVATRARAT